MQFNAYFMPLRMHITIYYKTFRYCLNVFIFLHLTLRALSVILYLLFLFLVVIVLLNVLIAQVSDTYSTVCSTAEGVYLYRRSRFITNLEKQLDYSASHVCHGDRKPGCRNVVCIVFSLDIHIVKLLQGWVS